VESESKEIVINAKYRTVKPAGARPTWMKRKMGKLKSRSPHGWWPEEAKEMAVAHFALTGNIRRVAEITTIPEYTLRGWKKEPWWQEMLDRVRIEGDEERDSKFSKIIDKAMDEINDRLENGDFILEAKTGQLKRKPISARDATIVTSTMIDKRQLLRGQPTSRSERVSTKDTLNALAEQFMKFAKATEVKGEIVYAEENGTGSEKRSSEEGSIEEAQ
jgi:hypothetical protein